MSKQKFWMVVGTGVPNVRHYDKDVAITEAERLARQCPGQEFTVLQSLATVKKTDVVWEDTDSADGPADGAMPF